MRAILHRMLSLRGWVEAVDFHAEEHNRLAGNLQWIAIITSVASLLISLIYFWVIIRPTTAWVLVLVAGISLIVMGLARRKHLTAASLLFLGMMLGIVTYELYRTNGIRSVGVTLYPVLLIFAGIILSRRLFMLYLGLLLLSLGFILYAEYRGWVVQNLEPASFVIFLIYAVILLATALVTALLTESLRNALARAWRNEQSFRVQSVMLDRVGQAVVGCRLDNTIVYWNRAATDLYGWPAAEALGRDFTEVVPTQQTPEMAEGIRQALRQAQVWSGEMTVQPRGRAAIPILGTLAPIPDEKGALTGWVGIAADLSEVKRAEQALREREERYRRAIEAIGGVPYVRDHATNTYTFMGEGILHLTGYPASEMTTALFGSLIEEVTLRGAAAPFAFEEAIRRARAGELADWRSDLRIRDRAGQTRWLMDGSIEIKGADGQSLGSIGVLQDITDRKAAEATIRQLNETLEQRVAERTEALRQRTAQLEAVNRELESFTYTVSHDLRAPIRAVDGFAHLLREEFSERLGPGGAHYLERVRDNTLRMGALIDDLLSFTRLGRQAPRPMAIASHDLVRMIQATAEQLQARAAEPVEVVIGELPPCHADLAQLRQVFGHLLTNAFKFTRQRADARIEVGGHLTEAGPMYFVRDNGVGFDMKYIHKLFGVFQRLHRVEEYEGTGVGLAIVQRIVQKHGGRVWAEAEVNQGATFYFTLGPARVETLTPAVQPV